MRHGMKRAGWWIRRLRGKWLLAFLVLAGAGAGLVYGGGDPATVGGIAGAVLVGLVMARPLAALGRRLFMRSPSWRSRTDSLEFADADLGFRVEGTAGKLSPRELPGAIADSGGRFAGGEISLELWVVATDERGQAWTVAQEVREQPAGRVEWTSSVDAEFGLVDVDSFGRPDPYRAAHRLVKQTFDIPTVDVEVVAWGREQHVSGTRDTVVAFARVSIGAEELAGFEYRGNRWQRVAHLVTLDLDGVAKTLGWGHPLQWRGGSALGLLEVLEVSEPGAWPALERLMAPRWHEKGMFVRLEREAERVTERAIAASS